MIQFPFMNDIDFATLLATPLSSDTDSYLSVPGLSGRGLTSTSRKRGRVSEDKYASHPGTTKLSISDMVFTPHHANSKLIIIIVYVYNKYLYGCA